MAQDMRGRRPYGEYADGMELSRLTNYRIHTDTGSCEHDRINLRALPHIPQALDIPVALAIASDRLAD